MKDDHLFSLVEEVIRTRDVACFSSFLSTFFQYGKSYNDLSSAFTHLIEKHSPKKDKDRGKDTNWTTKEDERHWREIRQHMGLCLAEWIKNHLNDSMSTDFKPKNLLILMSQLIDKGPEYTFLRSTVLQSGNRKSEERLPSVSRSILASKPEDIANWITMVDWKDFSRIHPSELTQKRWQQPNRDEVAPHVVRLTQRFNSLTYWLILQILRSPSSQVALTAVERSIALLGNLLSLHNYHSAAAILAALQHFSISRLKKTVWNKLSSSCKKSMQESEEVLTLLSNYAKYSIPSRGFEYRKKRQKSGFFLEGS